MQRHEISDATGFDSDLRFTDATAVRDYFTVENMRDMGIGRPWAQSAGTEGIAGYVLADADWQERLNQMADEVIEHRWHMIGEVERRDHRTVIVHTGDYGACRITTFAAYVVDCWEDDDEVAPEERFAARVWETTEVVQPGGGIVTRASAPVWDPQPLLSPEPPSRDELRETERSEADALVESCREED